MMIEVYVKFKCLSLAHHFLLIAFGGPGAISDRH